MDEQKLDVKDLESMSGGLIVEADDGYYIVNYERGGHVYEKADTLDEAKKKARSWNTSTNVISTQKYKDYFGKEFHPWN